MREYHDKANFEIIETTKEKKKLSSNQQKHLDYILHIFSTLTK